MCVPVAGMRQYKISKYSNKFNVMITKIIRLQDNAGYIIYRYMLYITMQCDNYCDTLKNIINFLEKVVVYTILLFFFTVRFIKYVSLYLQYFEFLNYIILQSKIIRYPCTL